MSMQFTLETSEKHCPYCDSYIFGAKKFHLFIINCGFKPNMTSYFKSASHIYAPFSGLATWQMVKLQPFISLNQSKHHCYTLSTTCTLFKLASEVGPRTNKLCAYSVHIVGSETFEWIFFCENSERLSYFNIVLCPELGFNFC